MITRNAIKQLEDALSRQAVVGLIGPRQVGKTTLALMVANNRPNVYLDLELKSDRDKLSSPELFLNMHEDKLVIFDEIHRMPELFQTLRSLVDQGRRKGKRVGRFLVLGSASIELLRQSDETLAGRIEYLDLNPLSILEIDNTAESMNRLWLRGGFPDSYLASNDEDSFRFRRSFIRTYLERDVPQFGPRIPAELLERLWTMLAHNQGTLLNASRLAASLSLSAPTVGAYLSLFVDLLLVRKLLPYHSNMGKRMVKSPKTYIRDSGLLHALLGIQNLTELAGHPVIGSSWEGFVIESLLTAAPEGTQASFYRTAAGAEVDLILDLGHRGVWAIEIKRSMNARPERGFYHALEDLKPQKAFVVYGGNDRYPLSETVEVISLRELAQELASDV